MAIKFLNTVQVDTDVLYVDAANDKVGIGTTSPDNTLDVVASDVNITPNAESSAVFRRNGNNYLTILSNASNEGGILFGNAVDDNDGSISYKHNTQSMQFATADAERIRITSGGNVGINTTSPVVRLHVQGNDIATRTTTTAQSVLRLVRDVVDASFPSTKDSAVDFMLSRQQAVNNNLPYTRLDIRLAGTTDSSTPSLDVMSLLHNGNVGIGTTNPSEKLSVSGDSNITGKFAVGSTSVHPTYDFYNQNTSYFNGALTLDNTFTQTGGGISIFSGNVGIGTTNPLNKLFVSASTAGDYAGFIENTNSTNGYGLVARTAHTGTSAYAFAARAGTSDIFVVRGDGNVGIGTTSPQNLLHLGDNTNSKAGTIRIDSFVANQFWKLEPGTNTLNIKDYDGTSLVSFDGNSNFVLFNGGNVGIGTTSPNRKLQVVGTDGAAKFYYNSSFTNAQYSVVDVGMMTSGTAANGFGPKITFRMGGNGYDGYATGTIGTIRNGADNTHNLNFGTSNSGSMTTKMTITNAGNVGIGTPTPTHLLTLETASSPGLKIKDTTQGATLLAFSQDSNSHIGTYSSHPLVFDTNSTERMRIDQNGNVGIGTTSPSTKLHVVGTLRAGGSSDYIELRDNGNIMLADSNCAIGPVYSGSPNNTLNIGFAFNGIWQTINHYATEFVWNPGILGAMDGMNLSGTGNLLVKGNVGIGTTAPLEKLQVAGNAAIYGAIKGYVGSSSNQYLSILQSSSLTYISTGTTNETIYFGIGPVSNVTNINVAGTATATNFILSSDKTLKDKIKDIKTNHVDVKWKNFELISEPGVKRSGVIAQELEAKHPEFIRTDKDGLKSVAYIDLLITKIAELEARIKKLEK